jgi:hypothetical protein
MRGMNIIQTINDSQAIPIRALPFVTDWELSPDKVAEILAHTDGHFSTRYMDGKPTLLRLTNSERWQ